MKKFLFLMAIAIMVSCVSTSCDTFKSEETPIPGGLVIFTAKGDDGKILKGLKTKGGVYRGMHVADGAVLLEAKCENIEYDDAFAWGTEPSGDVWAVSVKDRKVIGPFTHFTHYRSRGNYYIGDRPVEKDKPESKLWYFPKTNLTVEILKQHEIEGPNHFVYCDKGTGTWFIINHDGEVLTQINDPVAIIHKKNNNDIYGYVLKKGGQYKLYLSPARVEVDTPWPLDRTLSEAQWQSLKKYYQTLRHQGDCEIMITKFSL